MITIRKIGEKKFVVMGVMEQQRKEALSAPPPDPILICRTTKEIVQFNTIDIKDIKRNYYTKIGEKNSSWSHREKKAFIHPRSIPF